MPKRQFERFGLNFMVRRADRVRIEEVTQRLGLGQSEICRRALRLGLQELMRVERIPGGITRDDSVSA